MPAAMNRRPVLASSLAAFVGVMILEVAGTAAPQVTPSGRGPILDTHMHARAAGFYGEPPIPICAPVERMPRWDQRKSMWQDDSPAPCKTPLLSPMTDADLLAQTVAMMRKHNVIGVLGGESRLVGE